ncbi:MULTISPECIES: DUF393 domain-containing protein [unclassified Lysobacter]|uniref:thiol-disulfide oxidoreductase DCC family protein n=1 Tax=unclassified Lysobacter TaxID=2635362 RepID=UPI001BE89812|nr:MULTISPECIES: DUF393 domain-containing protein [unclassified Lysobacter]MBT2745286.1 DUF393 domain-containing protein [Lysobacter sp. ISL-42]MBT2751883.1 DUF393 domain-containing protein [Lysobacter sp. ISL-50]MBT2777848.1 DUF393 domain-containing protein [Lysobacter sp. ISL-54]MBT2783104.1 DUF393 domain-containing protein [Lysobacter sp. ISL-52]
MSSESIPGRLANAQVIALYDRACPLCRAEMHRLKAGDRHDRLRLVDIADPRFDAAQWGFELDALRNSLHVRAADGEWRIGVPGIAEAYRAVGLGWLTWPLRVPGAGRLAARAYRWIAPNRHRVSRWLGYREAGQDAAPHCDDGHCPTHY